MWISLSFLDCLLNDAAIVIKRNRVYATIEFLICLCGASSNSELVRMGHFHEEDIWLQLPQLISFLLSYLNLSILLRFKKQYPKFTQENNKLKNSGGCSKMTSSSNRPNAVSNVALTGINLILFFHLKLLIYFLSMTARVRSMIIIVKALKNLKTYPQRWESR